MILAPFSYSLARRFLKACFSYLDLNACSFSHASSSLKAYASYLTFMNFSYSVGSKPLNPYSPCYRLTASSPIVLITVLVSCISCVNLMTTFFLLSIEIGLEYRFLATIG